MPNILSHADYVFSTSVVHSHCLIVHADAYGVESFWTPFRFIFNEVAIFIVVGRTMNVKLGRIILASDNALACETKTTNIRILIANVWLQIYHLRRNGWRLRPFPIKYKKKKKNIPVLSISAITILGRNRMWRVIYIHLICRMDVCYMNCVI